MTYEAMKVRSRKLQEKIALCDMAFSHGCNTTSHVHKYTNSHKMFQCVVPEPACRRRRHGPHMRLARCLSPLSSVGRLKQVIDRFFKVR